MDTHVPTWTKDVESECRVGNKRVGAQNAPNTLDPKGTTKT